MLKRFGNTAPAEGALRSQELKMNENVSQSVWNSECYFSDQSTAIQFYASRIALGFRARLPELTYDPNDAHAWLVEWEFKESIPERERLE